MFDLVKAANEIAESLIERDPQQRSFWAETNQVKTIATAYSKNVLCACIETGCHNQTIQDVQGGLYSSIVGREHAELCQNCQTIYYAYFGRYIGE